MKAKKYESDPFREKLLGGFRVRSERCKKYPETVEDLRFILRENKITWKHLTERNNNSLWLKSSCFLKTNFKARLGLYLGRQAVAITSRGKFVFIRFITFSFDIGIFIQKYPVLDAKGAGITLNYPWRHTVKTLEQLDYGRPIITEETSEAE